MALAYFAARLECLHCGAWADDDIQTYMQHQLSAVPSRVYHVGDVVPVDRDMLEYAFLGATAAKRTSSDAENHLLQDWSCPSCAHRQWAEIVLLAGKIQSITSVRLTAGLMNRVHYVTDAIHDLYATIVDESLFDGLEHDPDFAEKLARHLPP